MNVYIIYNDKNDIVAYTDDKEILDIYLRNIQYFTKKDYTYKKIKYKNIENKSEYDDLYLVRLGDTYVPKKYLLYAEIASESVNELRYAKDILMKNLELRDMSKKDRKLIEKVLLLLEDWYTDDKLYTSSEDELSKLEDHYQPYVEGWFK